MQAYQFAEPDGRIISEEYDSSIRPSQEETLQYLKDALSVFGRHAEVYQELDETYRVSYLDGSEEKDIYISLKPVTPGGRSSSSDLGNEHRILQLPIYLNWVNDKKTEGKRAAFLGIYRRSGEILICAWKVTGTSADAASRVSKQIKVDTLANAMRFGIAQQKRNSDDYVCAFRKEFIYFFFENIDQFTGGNVAESHPDLSTPVVDTPDVGLEEVRKTTGCNILLYGVPGSGKSWTIEHELVRKGSIVERLVFHPDYTNADFVGQIMPVVDEDKQVTYEFTEGPFTTIMKNAYKDPTHEYILIIEEINRGNAPAIFGEVFQLLDRKVSSDDEEHDDGYPVASSEYGITHKNMAKKIYGDETHKVRIPSNLSLIGTMNTSDQNVFTLDTAFQRRWSMRLISNDFDNVRPQLADAEILDTGVTWRKFCTTINRIIIGNKSKMASAEDKRLGVYFVHENDLRANPDAKPSSPGVSLYDEYSTLLRKERDKSLSTNEEIRLQRLREGLKDIRRFPEKVIKYLWDDAFKFNPQDLFDTDNMDSLEKVISVFIFSQEQDRYNIFKQSVRSLLYSGE